MRMPRGTRAGRREDTDSWGGVTDYTICEDCPEPTILRSECARTPWREKARERSRSRASVHWFLRVEVTAAGSPPAPVPVWTGGNAGGAGSRPGPLLHPPRGGGAPGGRRAGRSTARLG